MLDITNKCIYRSSTAGTAALKSKILKTATGANLGGPNGLTMNGDTVWVLDGKNGIYRYSLSTLFNGTGNQNAAAKIALATANSKGESIYNDLGYLYVLDNGTSKNIYRYVKNGTTNVKSKNLLSNTGTTPSNTTGLTFYNNLFYVTDRGLDKVLPYTASTLFTGTTGQNATALLAVNSTNLDATGIATVTTSALLRAPEATAAIPPHSNAAITAYPNPTSGDVRVDYTMLKAGNMDVSVLSLDGRLILHRDFDHLAEGDYTITLPLGELTLPSGIYLLRCVRNEETDVLRIVVQY